jgi:predicted anti-sigma-YlaC factor YlaD
VIVLQRLAWALTLCCEAASELISRELDEVLPRLDRAAVLCHSVACTSCRRFRKQVRLIRQAMHRREQFLAETDLPEGRLSSAGRDRIARACDTARRDDVDLGNMIE